MLSPGAARKLVKLGLLFMLLAGAASSALAQGGPPLITDDPGTPGNHNWEINTALTLESHPGETDLEVPFVDINYGAGDRVQLNFQIPYAAQVTGQQTRFGLGNSMIGVKWRFVDEDQHGVAISTYPHLTLNNPGSSVRRGLADDGWQLFLPVEVLKTFGKFELNGEAGYNFQQSRPNEIWLGLAEGYVVSERLELLFELHSIQAVNFKENESVFDFGSRIKLTHLNTLLLAAGRSLPGSTAAQPRFFMYTGLQFTF